MSSSLVSQPAFQFTVGTFEGPIELLLHLVEERKMPINDVSLATITDTYITYLHSHENISYSAMTHFIAVAATLILIKARSLVATLEVTEEEQSSIDDLQERLRLYQIYSNYAQQLRLRVGKKQWYARPFVLKRTIVFSPDRTVLNTNTLAQIMGEVCKATPEPETVLPEARMRMTVRIEDFIDQLRERIQHAVKNISFRDFAHSTLEPDASPYKKKVYAIVSFLAVLEMARHGIITLSQAGTFEDVIIDRVV
jgi:segregation and condensation protein A